MSVAGISANLWRVWLFLAGVSGAAAVAAGAYGAHGLSAKEPVLVEAFRSGVLYHLVHSVALLGVAFAAERAGAAGRPALAHAAGACFVVGVVLFSGTLYAFGITGFVPVTGAAPAGGVAFVAGWLALAVSAFGRRENAA